MLFLYNIAFILFCLIYLPTFFLKKKSGDHLWERFGSVPELQKGKGKIFWFHAVSVGEALASLSLIQALRSAFPDSRFAFSTTTKTGRTILEKNLKESDTLFYFPLDFTWVVRRVIRRVKPDVFATMETEIWPNLIAALKRSNIPIFLLNGRLSEKSFRRYRSVRWAIAKSLKKIDLFCMQDSEDGERIRALGAPPEKVHLVGSMKFDIAFSKEEISSGTMREKLGLGKEEKLWVAGSTHPGEEKSLLELYADLSKEYPFLRLLIAPRHPERTTEVVKLIDAFHREAALFSENGRWEENSSSILVLDTIGQLRSLYAASDIVFIGGSLVPKGGQNLLEPAFFAKPILFGPHMENFRGIVQLFLSRSAAVQVQNKEELSLILRSLLKDEVLCRSLGERAKEILLEQQGAVHRHLERIQEFLKR